MTHEVTCCECGEIIGFTDGMVPAIECPDCYEEFISEQISQID